MKIPVIVIALFAATLAGCGGGGGGGGVGSTSGSSGDTFVAAAALIALNSPDDVEPADVEAILETMPETQEPEAQ